MDDTTNNGAGEALPQGATSAPSQNSGVGEALPQGATSTAPTDPTGSSAPTSTGHHADLVNPIATQGAQLLSGVGEGIFSTVSGGAHLLNKIPGVHIPTDTLDTLAGTNEEKTGAEKVGYAGETLAEFLLGDEALKGLSYADKLMQTAKTAKILEKSPKLIKALELGANAMKAGVVQGAQTTIRTGGDIKEGAKEGAIMAGTTGVLGAVGSGVEKVASSLSKGSKAAKGLAEMAANSPEKAAVAEGVQNALNKSERGLHETYESGINDLKDRLSDSELEVKGSPVSNKATALLQHPDPDEHELVTMSKEGYGEKLDKGVRNLLELASKGERPVEAEGGEASKILLTDAEPKAAETEPQTEPIEPWTVDSLIDFRQAVRKQAEVYERGNINSRALKQLLPSIDDTIGKLAEQSGDANAVKDYDALRANYRDKINLYDLPVIKNLQEGKLDDAAKEFLSKSNQAQYKTESLRTLLGNEEMDKFSHKVFQTMLGDAVDQTGNFNAANLMRSWEKIPEETRDTFFQPKTSGQDITKLMKDANTAANIQKLTRVGLLAGLGAIGGGASHLAFGTGVGTLLGLTIGSEGLGGFAKGRELLDYIANHPNTWKAFRAAGKVTASPVTAATGKVVTGATGQALGGINSQNSKRTVYSGAQSLAGQ